MADKPHVKFTFEKAYAGAWKALNLANFRERFDARGIYVKISIEIHKMDFDEIHVIQIGRMITFKDGKKLPVPANEVLSKDDPGDPRYQLAGLALPPDAAADLRKAQGWFVDVNSTRNNKAFWTRSFLGNPGVPAKGLKAEIWDTAYVPDKLMRRDIGSEFYTSVIGIKKGNATFLGYLHWGYYIDAKGDVSFDPRIPVKAGSTVPAELRPALARWNFYADKLRPPREPLPNIGGL